MTKGEPYLSDDDSEPRQTGWPWLRGKLFHLLFLLKRPMTLGARGLVHDRETNSVFLIRHTYVPGWQLPGGGVETGETFEEALRRELSEEGNIELTAPPALFGLYFNRHASKRDHVALYVVTDYRQTSVRIADIEIAEARFFPIDALPEGITRGTRRRIEEALLSAPRRLYW